MPAGPASCCCSTPRCTWSTAARCPSLPWSKVPSGEQFEAVAHRGGVDGAVDVSELRYEVMYFLDLLDDRIGAFKEAWGEIGDSIVVVGGDGIWNCHVHTNDIGAAIEAALGLDGRPRQIRVTDLFEEVADEHAVREAAMRGVAAAPAASTPSFTPASAGLLPVTTAVVAVCSGDGLAELFWQLGVQGIVTGGQTMNPSTAELLDAVDHVNADQVVVLPNNKNIIPVAEQVDALSAKHVAVVPTRSMPEALAALVVYDPEASAEANAAAMSDAADSVATGEVTRAVRDTSADVGRITAGDWIGLVRGDGIVSVSGRLEGAATALLEQLVTDEREILTIIVGADAPTAVTDAAARLGQRQPPWAAGRGARRRSAALPVPVRGRVTAAGAETAPAGAALTLRDLDAIDVGRVRGVGEASGRRCRRSASRPCSTSSPPIRAVGSTARTRPASATWWRGRRRS